MRDIPSPATTQSVSYTHLVSAITNFVPYAFLCKKSTVQTVWVEQTESPQQWCLAMECQDTINQACSRVYFYSTAPVEPCENGLRIQLTGGKNEIFISYGEPVRLNEISESRERTSAIWLSLIHICIPQRGGRSTEGGGTSL